MAIQISGTTGVTKLPVMALKKRPRETPTRKRKETAFNVGLHTIPTRRRWNGTDESCPTTKRLLLLLSSPTAPVTNSTPSKTTSRGVCNYTSAIPWVYANQAPVDFTFFISTGPAGVSLHDIRFKGERIVYELA